MVGSFLFPIVRHDTLWLAAAQCCSAARQVGALAYTTALGIYARTCCRVVDAYVAVPGVCACCRVVLQHLRDCNDTEAQAAFAAKKASCMCDLYTALDTAPFLESNIVDCIPFQKGRYC